MELFFIDVFDLVIPVFKNIIIIKITINGKPLCGLGLN
jgi:hypothetical protein